MFSHIKSRNTSKPGVKFCEKIEPSTIYFVILLFTMKILKPRRYIFSVVLLIFLVNTAPATNGQENREANQEQKQQGQQEGRKSNQTMMEPDGDRVPGQQTQGYQEEHAESEPKDNNSSKLANEKVDSLQDDSLSKYNFIFYFLYKFKYESESP